MEKSSLLNMPEIEYGSYLLEFLQELGIYSSTGFGLAPLTFCEIQAWKTTTETNINGWESRMLRFLSCAYVGQHNISDDITCIAPYSEERQMLKSNDTVVEKFKKLLATRKK